MLNPSVMLMVLLMSPAVTVMGVNNDVIRQAQEGGDNASVNGNSTSNERGQCYSRLNTLVSHVTPAQPGPYGWAPNPFTAVADPQANTPSLSPPSLVTEASQTAATVSTASSSGAGTLNHMDSLPLDFPSGSMTRHWGTSVESRHAAWLWGLKFRGYSLLQWIRHFAQFGLWEWSTLCSQTEAQGQLWTDVEWYEYSQQHYYTWTSLVWCLCCLHITPDVARRMISAQYFHNKRLEFRDDSHGSDGGSSSSGF